MYHDFTKFWLTMFAIIFVSIVCIAVAPAVTVYVSAMLAIAGICAHGIERIARHRR